MMAKGYSGTLGGLKLPDICLTGEEKPRINLTQETCPDRDRNRDRCVTGAHAASWPSAVDVTVSNMLPLIRLLHDLSKLIIFLINGRRERVQTVKLFKYIM